MWQSSAHRSLGVLTQDLQLPAVMSHRYSNPIETSVTVTLLVFLRVLIYVVRGSFNALFCTSRSKTNQGVEPLESRAVPRTSACWLTFRGFPSVDDRSFKCSWWPFAAQANEGWSGDRLHGTVSANIVFKFWREIPIQLGSRLGLRFQKEGLTWPYSNQRTSGNVSS